MHPSEDQNGEPKERSAVRKFKAWPKYLRRLSIVSVSGFFLGVCLLVIQGLVIKPGLAEILSPLAWAFIQLSITLIIVNIVLHQAIESPRRFLIWDANRELEEFSRQNPGAAEIAKFISEIENQRLDRDCLANFVIRSERVWGEFLNLKSRTQNAREGSKELAHKYWAFEIILMAEMDFFKFLSEVLDRDISSGIFKWKMNYRGALERLHNGYSMSLGGLPMPPGSPYWSNAVESIERHLWPSEQNCASQTTSSSRT